MATAAPCEQPRERQEILVVDDDPALRELWTRLLSRHDYDVRTAGDGLEALQQLKQSLPDLIISDLRMPRMSGFEFLSIVRRRFPQLPLIAVSGEFLVSGHPVLGIADEFLAKGDHTPQELIAKVADLLARPPVRPALDSPPMWVPVSPSGEVVLTFTNCLRSFSVRVCPPAMGNPMREIGCAACSTLLRYCIDEMTLPVGQRAWESCGGLTKLAGLRDDCEK